MRALFEDQANNLRQLFQEKSFTPTLGKYFNLIHEIQFSVSYSSTDISAGT
jgi:hypothetical protein